MALGLNSGSHQDVSPFAFNESQQISGIAPLHNAIYTAVKTTHKQEVN